MNCILLFFIYSLIITETTIEANNESLNSLNLNYTITDRVLKHFNPNHYGNRSGEITAVINDYADNVFKNVQKSIIRNGLDPMEIPDQLLKLFPTGTINLTKGWLEDTSTISRYNDVMVTYRSSMKKITFAVPIQFQSLMFIYKYYTKVLLVKASGDVQGKMKNIKANIMLSFDFEKYVASLDKFDITDTGSISLSFSGNGLLDWITSSMTSAITLFFHPFIIRIIQSMIKGSLDKVLTVINETIEEILHK